MMMRGILLVLMICTLAVIRITGDPRVGTLCQQQPQPEIQERKENINYDGIPADIINGVTTTIWGFPPEKGFSFRDRRAGKLTGFEEPVYHLRIWPQYAGVLKIDFMFYHTVNGSQAKRVLYIDDFRERNEEFGRIIRRCDKVVVTTHGWRRSSEVNPTKRLKDALIESDPNLCVIAVHWGRPHFYPGLLNERLYYVHSTVNVITVGRWQAIVLFDLYRRGYVCAHQIQLIGIGLGAHAVHFASQWFEQLQHDHPTILPGRVARDEGHRDRCCPDDMPDAKCDDRIDKFARATGLDPSAPQFRGYKGAHIFRGDADFVDIIHTASVIRSKVDDHRMMTLRQNLILPGFTRPADYVDIPFDTFEMTSGDPNPIGDVDFYPNGGITPQPGCEFCFSLTLSTACSHTSAVEYYILSLKERNTKRFRATECSTPGPNLPGYLAAIFRPFNPVYQPCPGHRVSPDKLDQAESNLMGANATKKGALGKLYVDLETDTLSCTQDGVSLVG